MSINFGLFSELTCCYSPFSGMPPRAFAGLNSGKSPNCYHNAVGNIEFAWDDRKAKSNAAKHGISFEEARTIFVDEFARLIDDPDHSSDEERFIMLGYSFLARCLVVSHCYLENETIRMISARRATATEEEFYWSLR